MHFDSRISDSLTIMICGHKSRDIRCGTLGPLLHREFYKFVASAVTRSKREAGVAWSTQAATKVHPLAFTNVDLCSHVGGHAYAGNVVIYLPRNWKAEDGEGLSPLAGLGVWYGRVEPRHVWGIMEETVGKGRVVGELVRGVHDPRSWLVDVVPEYAKSTKPENMDFRIRFHNAA